MLLVALLIIGVGPVWPEENPESIRELESLGETSVAPRERMDSTITSVGKKAQRLSESAAAIYVITPEDIRRSGVTSIPEALRLAPGMDVARIDSNKWAISARGFNGRFANKLLVLMDGREVYNPSFGGVYWEVQDLPLEDIDRIEVIRGPGAALWGANAVNGVVNIITKNARDTQGGSLSGGGGSYEQGFGSLRYGLALDEHTHGRVYAKGFNRGGFASPTGSADDSWSMTQTGFRLDRDAGTGSRLMASGAAYREDFNQQVLLPSLGPPLLNFVDRDRGTASGFNLLGRWNQSLSLSSEFSLQAFYDHTYRTEAFLTQERDTLDLEFQHRFLWWERHDITWGLVLLCQIHSNALADRRA
jgi:iron complex outermembrane receptor protein